MALLFILYAAAYITLLVLEIKTGRQLKKYRSGEYYPYDFKEKAKKRLGIGMAALLLAILLISLISTNEGGSLALAAVWKRFIVMVLIPNDAFVFICGAAYLRMLK